MCTGFRVVGWSGGYGGCHDGGGLGLVLTGNSG